MDNKGDTKPSKELMERINAFITDYRAVVNKHKIDIIAEITASSQGIKPITSFIDITEQIKEEEAKKDSKQANT